MSEIAIGGRGQGADTPFVPRTVALLLIVGLLGFAGSLLLGAYAPDLRADRTAGTNALSKAAIGYSGIVALARATGRNPRVVRAEADWDTEDLVIATPDHGTVDVGKFTAARRGRATLIVLPKWQTAPDKTHGGWVTTGGLLPAADPSMMLEPARTLRVTRRPSGARPLHAVAWAPKAMAVAAPRPLQTIASPQLIPFLTDAAGRIVLGRIGNSKVYILADPDLLNNRGLRTFAGAQAAVDLIDFVNATGAEGVAFDVVMNGLGRERSPLKLAFEPPFLALTLSITVVLVLIGWQALVRFGAVRPPVRAIAFGKAALVDNSAMIVRKARREGALGGRYVALARDRARAVFAVPPRLSDEEADHYLDRLDGRGSFTALVADAERATHRSDMLAAAQALHQWQGETTR